VETVNPLAKLFVKQTLIELCLRCQLEICFDDVLHGTLETAVLKELKEVLFGTLFRITP
jgi:hypothetical protein